LLDSDHPSPPSPPIKPDRLLLKSTSDRPLTPKPRSPIPKNQPAIAPFITQHPIACFPQIKQRSPLHHPKPDRLNLNINQRSPLITQNLIAYFPKSNSDPLTNPIA
jgi:hypothetical protein